MTLTQNMKMTPSQFNLTSHIATACFLINEHVGPATTTPQLLLGSYSRKINNIQEITKLNHIYHSIVAQHCDIFSNDSYTKKQHNNAQQYKQQVAQFSDRNRLAYYYVVVDNILAPLPLNNCLGGFLDSWELGCM